MEEMDVSGKEQYIGNRAWAQNLIWNRTVERKDSTVESISSKKDHDYVYISV